MVFNVLIVHVFDLQHSWDIWETGTFNNSHSLFQKYTRIERYFTILTIHSIVRSVRR